MNITKFEVMSFLSTQVEEFKNKNFHIFNRFNVESAIMEYYDDLTDEFSLVFKLFKDDYETLEHSIQTLLLFVAYTTTFERRYNQVFPPKTYIKSLKSCLLHDLGKTDSRIFEIKSIKGSLSPELKEEMKKHVDIGVDVFRKHFKHDTFIETHILFHHEKTDCTGYKGLELKNPSVLLLSICDVISALSQSRSYSTEIRDYENTISCMEKWNSFDKEILDFLKTA